MHVVRAEIDLPEVEDLYAEIVYETAKANLNRLMKEGVLIREEEGALYLYSQRMGDHIQYGIVAAAILKITKKEDQNSRENPSCKRGRSN